MTIVLKFHLPPLANYHVLKFCLPPLANYNDLEFPPSPPPSA